MHDTANMRQVATRLFTIDYYNTDGRLRASVDEISPQVSPFFIISNSATSSFIVESAELSS